MRVLFLALFGLLALGSFSLTGLAAEADEYAPKPIDIKVFKGKVALVYSETPMHNYPGRIEVVDESGQRLVFIVVEATAISKNGTKTNLKNADKGDNVTIEYTSDNKNHKVAQIIKIYN